MKMPPLLFNRAFSIELTLMTYCIIDSKRPRAVLDVQRFLREKIAPAARKKCPVRPNPVRPKSRGPRNLSS